MSAATLPGWAFAPGARVLANVSLAMPRMTGTVLAPSAMGPGWVVVRLDDEGASYCGVAVVNMPENRCEALPC